MNREEFKSLANASRLSGRAVIDEALITITKLRAELAEAKRHVELMADELEGKE